VNTKVSIIIRTKNEGRWIKQCLSAVFSQSYKNFEVILVDNNSTDATVKKASVFDIKLVNIENYKPGLAINKGIENSTGDIFVILSGHCIPTNKFWLENLINNLKDHNVAGVYGRQEPLSFSADSDKRDLSIVFGLDKKVQIKDTFFHNANSALTRNIWDQFPFDSEINHIEDRLWGKDVIGAGLKIVYEPEASVYHYHGIHQNNHPERLKNVVKILEQHDVVPNNQIEDESQTAIFIPINQQLDFINNHSALHYIAETIKSSQYLNIENAVIIANIPKVIEEANQCGFTHIYHRPNHLSDPFVTVDDVIMHTLMEYDFRDSYPDTVVYMSPRIPYRSNEITDGMYSDFIEGNYDVLFPAYNEKRTVWLKNENEIKKFETTMPTKLKKGIDVVIAGLCTIARSEYYLNNKEHLKTGLYEVKDSAYLIDLKSDIGKNLMKYLLK
jgi:rhamnosyltransferase